MIRFETERFLTVAKHVIFRTAPDGNYRRLAITPAPSNFPSSRLAGILLRVHIYAQQTDSQCMEKCVSR